MYASFIGFAKFLLLFTIWLFFVVALVAYSKIAFGRFWPQFVQVGTFNDINDGTKEVGAILIGRAEELSRPVTLDALFEVKVPPITKNFGVKDDLKFLDDVKLSLQGVDVPAVIRAALNALPDHQYLITAKAGTAGTGNPVLNMEFVSPSGERKAWLLRAENTPTGSPKPSASATTSQVIDRAIYTIWYYMYYDPKGLKWRNNLEANFTSARALEAYYGGQQRLASYQRTFQASDLDEAEREFRLLISEMPHFVSGWMFLGITLVEKRSERAAIRAFERAQRLLSPGGVLRANISHTDRLTWLQARLFTANAQLQLYDWKENHDALRSLEGILPTLPDAIPAGMSAPNFFDISKVRFSVLFQAAHNIGHDLTLLNEDNFVSALTEAPSTPAGTIAVPAAVRPIAARQKELQDHEEAVRKAPDDAQRATAKAQLLTDFGAEIDRIFAAQQQMVAAADAALTKINDFVDANTAYKQISKDEWHRHREKLAADLANADGYAKFRYAQLREPDDRLFRQRCNEALAKLTEAQAARPNEYTILQNMALIYGDARYDPEGKDIDTAQALFTRSLEIKSRDYYGHQKLATLVIRQAYERGVEFLSTEAIADAITKAEKARELRPNYGTIVALLSQLYILKWIKASDSDQKSIAPLIEATLMRAERGDRASSIHLWTAKLQWRLARLRGIADKTEFDKAKVKFLAALHQAEIEVAPSTLWDARDLVARVKRLTVDLQKIEVEDRAALNWAY